MKIVNNNHDKIAVLKLEGLLESSRDLEIKEKLQLLVNDKIITIAVDLSNVDNMDSTIVGIMVQYWRKQKSLNRELVLVGPNKKIRRLLSATKLDTIFRIYLNKKTLMHSV